MTLHYIHTHGSRVQAAQTLRWALHDLTKHALAEKEGILCWCFDIKLHGEVYMENFHEGESLPGLSRPRVFELDLGG